MTKAHSRRVQIWVSSLTISRSSSSFKTLWFVNILSIATCLETLRTCHGAMRGPRCQTARLPLWYRVWHRARRVHMPPVCWFLVSLLFWREHARHPHAYDTRDSKKSPAKRSSGFATSVKRGRPRLKRAQTSPRSGNGREIRTWNATYKGSTRSASVLVSLCTRKTKASNTGSRHRCHMYANRHKDL